MVRHDGRCGRMILAMTVGLALLAIGCSSDDGSDDGPVAVGPVGACEGESFDSSSTAPGTVAFFVDQGDGFAFRSFAIDEEMRPIVPDDAEYVMCLTVTSSEVAETCEFEDEGETFTLEQSDVTYDAELRVAATAEVVESTSIDLDAEECPTITSFEPGEASRVGLPDPVESLEDMLQDNVG